MAPLKIKFPYNKEGHPHWHKLVDMFFEERLHVNTAGPYGDDSYTGESMWEDQWEGGYIYEDEIYPKEDWIARPWVIKYTKEAFVKAWNRIKCAVEYIEKEEEEKCKHGHEEAAGAGK